MEITVKRYQKTDFDLWNKINEESKNGLFFFNRNFMEYHADRFVDHSLLIYKKNKVIALLPANEREETIISHGGLTFGSLVLPYSTKAAEVLEIFDAIIFYYKNLGFKKLLYKAIPSIFSRYPAEEDLYALFRNKAQLVRRDISTVIDLKNKIEPNENKKRLIKKCRNLQLEIKESQQFEQYWELLSAVLKKHNTTPVHSVSEIKNLKEKFPQNIRLFTAEKDNTIYGGVLLFMFGNVVHTQYLASSAEGRQCGALDFLTDFLTGYFHDQAYYSFGISTENNGQYLNEGLIMQKESLGGRGICLDTYELTF